MVHYQLGLFRPGNPAAPFWSTPLQTSPIASFSTGDIVAAGGQRYSVDRVAQTILVNGNDVTVMTGIVIGQGAAFAEFDSPKGGWVTSE